MQSFKYIIYFDLIKWSAYFETCCPMQYLYVLRKNIKSVHPTDNNILPGEMHLIFAYGQNPGKYPGEHIFTL